MGLLACLREFWHDLTRDPPSPHAGAAVTTAETTPDAQALAALAAARQALLRGDPEAGAAAAATAAQRDPRDVVALYTLGQARLRQGRRAEARAAFQQAAAGHDPFQLAQTWLARLEPPGSRPGTDLQASMEAERAARLAALRGRLEEACALSREAVALAPENLLAHHQLGRLLLALGRRDEAIATFEAARAYDDELGLVDGWLANLDREWEAIQVAWDDDE